jgi:hypothetical protein
MIMFDNEPPLTPMSEEQRPMRYERQHGRAVRQVVGKPPLFVPEQQFCGNDAGHDGKRDLEQGRRGDGRERRAGRDPGNGRQRPCANHIRQPDAGRAVGKIGAERRRHDDRKRGPDAELHADFFRDTKRAKHFVEHRDDDAAAANAEQAGEDAGRHAAAGNRGRQQGKFLKRHACSLFLPPLTGEGDGHALRQR